MKRDVENIRTKLSESQDSLKEMRHQLGDTTTKEEFYDFIRELNDELRKLEKHIATQESLDRLRANLKTQIGELESEVMARKAINQKLSMLGELEGRTNTLKARVEELAAFEKKIQKIENSYVDSREFLKKVKGINKEENAARVKELQKAIDSELGATKQKFQELKKEAATRSELREERDSLRAIAKEQSKRIQRLESQMKRLDGKKAPTKVIKGRAGLIERGLNAISKLFGKTNIFPLIVLIIIAALLVVGIVFFREDIFSPQLYMDPKSVECQTSFECKQLTQGQLLVDCRYDTTLEGCHCTAKSAELTDCPPEQPSS